MSLLDTVLGAVIAIFRHPKNDPAFDSAILGDSEVRGDLILLKPESRARRLAFVGTPLTTVLAQKLEDIYSAHPRFWL